MTTLQKIFFPKYLVKNINFLLFSFFYLFFILIAYNTIRSTKSFIDALIFILSYIFILIFYFYILYLKFEYDAKSRYKHFKILSNIRDLSSDDEYQMFGNKFSCRKELQDRDFLLEHEFGEFISNYAQKFS